MVGGYCRLMSISDEVRPDGGRADSACDPPDEFIDDLLLERPYILSLDAAEVEAGRGGGTSLVARGWWEYSECAVEIVESRALRLVGILDEDDFCRSWFGAPETNIGVLSAIDIGRSPLRCGGSSE